MPLVIEIPPATPRASSERTTQVRLLAPRSSALEGGFEKASPLDHRSGRIDGRAARLRHPARRASEHNADYKQRLAQLHLGIADASVAETDSRTLIARAKR